MRRLQAQIALSVAFALWVAAALPCPDVILPSAIRSAGPTERPLRAEPAPMADRATPAAHDHEHGHRHGHAPAARPTSERARHSAHEHSAHHHSAHDHSEHAHPAYGHAASDRSAHGHSGHDHSSHGHSGRDHPGDAHAASSPPGTSTDTDDTPALGAPCQCGCDASTPRASSGTSRLPAFVCVAVELPAPPIVSTRTWSDPELDPPAPFDAPEPIPI